MSVIPSSSKPIESIDVQPFLNRVGSLHLHTENGERLVYRYHELPIEKQEQIGRIVQLLLRSSSFYTHLQNHKGCFNIVYKKEKEREFFIIAGKMIDLGQSLESSEETSEVKKQEKSLLADIQAHSEIVGVGADVLSFLRNTLSALATASLENIHSAASIAVDGLRFVGGAAGVVGGSILISKGVEKVINSKEEEEFSLGSLQVVSGTGYLGFGISSMMLGVANFFAAGAGFAEAVSTFAITPCLSVMNTGFLFIGLYQLTMTGSFRSDFNQAIEKNGAKGGIDFLYENLFLNQEEQKIVDAIIDPKERVDKTKEILDRKRAHLGRRIGNEVVEEIASKIAELKKSFDHGHVSAEVMSFAKSLLEKVSEANSREILKAALMILIAVASIAATLALGPAGSFAFFAAIAICWFILDCTKTVNLTADLVWKLHELVMGLILVINEGSDEEFMKFLERYDPTLINADMQTKASAYLEARAELGGGVYNLFKLFKKVKEGPELLLILGEIWQASLEGDLENPEQWADSLCSAMPSFYECMIEKLPEKSGHETICEALKLVYERTPGISHLPKEMQLKLAALYLLSALYENDVRRIESVLDHFEAIKESREDKGNLSAQFMRYLMMIDPALKKANLREARVLLQNYLEVWDQHVKLFQKMRGQTTLSQGFFDLSCDSEFKTKSGAEAMIQYIQEKYPHFWRTIERGFSKEKFENAIENGTVSWDALWIATKLEDSSRQIKALVAKEFREMMEEIRSVSVPSERDLPELLDTLKSSTPLFYAFLTKKKGDAEARKALLQAHEKWLAKFPEMKFLPDEEHLKPAALDLLSSLFTSEEKRAAVFGRFDSTQIQKMAEKKEQGLSLMQLGCSLKFEFSFLGNQKTAYEKIEYPELLLSEDETMILQRQNEYLELAAKGFPDVYKLAMKNPALLGRSIHEDLEEELKTLEKLNFQGEEFTVSHQTFVDYDRSPNTLILGERFKTGENEGTKVLLKLRELAKEDEKLFHFLAAFYSQTPKNFALYFQEEMKRNEILTELYIPIAKVLEQRFIQKEDGSFEIHYDFEFTLTSELDGTKVVLPLTTTFRLEKENGEWICRNPVYSDTIQVDGHPS